MGVMSPVRPSPTRVGVVGAGAVARRHVATLLGFHDVRVVGVADPVPRAAAALAAQAGATAYPHHRALLEAGLDAVYICVPPFAHGDPELDAVAAGVPFFVEKPLAADLATAVDIAARLEGSGLVTATGYHWRYLDTVEHARRLLADRPARLVLGYWLDKVPPPAWWLRRDRSGGQTVEQTTHVIDLARTLAGEVTEVHGAAALTVRGAYPDTDVADVTAATLRFASGAVGSVSSTCLLGWKHRAGVAVMAEGLALEVSEDQLTVDTGDGPRTVRACGDAKTRVDRAFVDAVQGRGDDVRAPYAEALRTHRVACAVASSADSEPAVKVDTGAPRG